MKKINILPLDFRSHSTFSHSIFASKIVYFVFRNNFLPQKTIMGERSAPSLVKKKSVGPQNLRFRKCYSQTKDQQAYRLGSSYILQSAKQIALDDQHHSKTNSNNFSLTKKNVETINNELDDITYQKPERKKQKTTEKEKRKLF